MAEVDPMTAFKERIKTDVLRKLNVERLWVGKHQETVHNRIALTEYSIFPSLDTLSDKDRIQLINDGCAISEQIDRSVAVMIGMVIGDWMGHPYEFLSIEKAAKCKLSITGRMKKKVTKVYECDKYTPWYERSKHKFHNEYNSFKLQRGQFTDDSCMGLCQCDSLLIHHYFNGSDIRIRFWNWWFNGYNNAFTLRSSVGLGGNIGSSIYDLKIGQPPSDVYEVKHDREDSGNGSLMRLSGMAIFFHNDIELAMKYSRLSSFTTHPGYIAAECCSLMAFIIVTAIKRDSSSDDGRSDLTATAADDESDKDDYKWYPMKRWLEQVTNDYGQRLQREITQLEQSLNIEIKALDPKVSSSSVDPVSTITDEKTDDDGNDHKPKEEDEEEMSDSALMMTEERKLKQREMDAKKLVLRLINSNEDIHGTECVWNWKSPFGKLPLIECFQNRRKGKTYNGYPVSGPYFGSYCMDGLSMALHCCYHSTDMLDAIISCINLLGDSDTTGSICGQIAGSFYGFNSLKSSKVEFKNVVECIHEWDIHYAFEMHGLLLYTLGLDYDDEMIQREVFIDDSSMVSDDGDDSDDSEDASPKESIVTMKSPKIESRRQFGVELIDEEYKQRTLEEERMRKEKIEAEIEEKKRQLAELRKPGGGASSTAVGSGSAAASATTSSSSGVSSFFSKLFGGSS